MKRLFIERAGPVLLIKTEVRQGCDSGWVPINTRVINDPGRIEVRTPVWITLRYTGKCKECEEHLTVGDRAYIDGGALLCEECGKIREGDLEEGN